MRVSLCATWRVLVKAELVCTACSLGDHAKRAALKGVNFYQALQMEDGHWPGDYGGKASACTCARSLLIKHPTQRFCCCVWHAGPMFLMPGMVITMYVTGTEIAEHKREQMIKYLFNHQDEKVGLSSASLCLFAWSVLTLRAMPCMQDGGWGIHIENGSTVFATALNYCSLRILGAACLFACAWPWPYHDTHCCCSLLAHCTGVDAKDERIVRAR